MPTINVEIMQQVLHEFTEKEALTNEEIKVIEQQVLELETRITVCRDRLQNLNEDKDRLATMMGRYSSAGSPAKLPQKGSSTKLKAMPKLADRPQSLSPRHVTESNNADISNASAKSGVIEDLEPANESDLSQNAADGTAGGDDAIKSINDALKGLFRK